MHKEITIMGKERGTRRPAQMALEGMKRAVLGHPSGGKSTFWFEKK